MTRPHHVFPLIPSRLPWTALSAEWPSAVLGCLFVNYKKVNPYILVGYVMVEEIERYSR